MATVVDRMNEAIQQRVFDGHTLTGCRIVVAFADYDSYGRIFEGYRTLFAPHQPDLAGTDRPLLYKGMPVVHDPAQVPGQVTIEPIPEEQHG